MRQCWKNMSQNLRTAVLHSIHTLSKANIWLWSFSYSIIFPKCLTDTCSLVLGWLNMKGAPNKGCYDILQHLSLWKRLMASSVTDKHLPADFEIYWKDNTSCCEALHCWVLGCWKISLLADLRGDPILKRLWDHSFKSLTWLLIK